MTTREYRQTQFDRVSTVYSEYKPMIKIVKPDGETNWMDISQIELDRIHDILTE